MITVTNRSLHAVLLSTILIAVSTLSFAQTTPARFYWKSLSGGQAVPVIAMSMSGNVNPVDPSNFLIPDSSFDADIVLAGYAQTFSLFERATTVAILVPMGSISGEASVLGKTFKATASGIGDPLLEFDINIIGPKAIKNIPELVRYEPGFSLDILVDLALPIGEYDDSSPINIGQNRWYGRIAAPTMLQIGPWIPGRRTTLELLPSLWLYGDNDDFVGETLSTDPMFELEAHLTHDFHKDLWGSLDLDWITGGAATLDGHTGDDLDVISLGATLGYHINDNLQITAGYMTSVNDTGPGDLQMDGFRLSFVFGWHPLIEGMKRLEGN